MTPIERGTPDLLNGSRKKRIASGSGTTIQDVNKLIKQFNETKKVMHMMSNKKNMANMMRQMKGMKGGGLPGM
jgi:signal recognition particle subunit SRP54